MFFYSVGIYARLSVEHCDEKDESIDTQIQIAKEYISKDPGLRFYKSYTDLGRTGTNFERDGFLQLMEDVRSGKINCIIVKDFSRLGRNYIETGSYIERIFPFYGVRFISVADHYDSLYEADCGDEWTLHLKNIVNELYARDISLRVKASKKAKKEQGSYVGGRPPYGYCIRLENEKRRLFPERETKEIVRSIFRLCDEGKSLKEIAVWLYKEKIHAPKKYYSTGHVRCEEGELLTEWSRTTIKALLKNPVYAGIDVQGKQKDPQKNAKEKSGCIQEALITKEVFDRVSQRLLHPSPRNDCCPDTGTDASETEIFGDVLCCGTCGGRLIRSWSVRKLANGNKARRYYYRCINAGRIDELGCNNKFISENVLKKAVSNALFWEIHLSALNLEKIYFANKKECEKAFRKCWNEFQRIDYRLARLELEECNAYADYRSSSLRPEDYLKEKRQYKEERTVLEKQKEEIRKELRRTEEKERESKARIRNLCEDRMIKADNRMIQCFVKKIIVYTGKRIEIVFLFGGDGLRNG